MPTPVEVIFAKQAEVAAETALKADQRELLNAYVNTYNQISYHVEYVASLARKHGKVALLADMPQEVQDAINASLEAVRTLWESCSPVPFPDMPDQPVPPEEPAPVETPE